MKMGKIDFYSDHSNVKSSRTCHFYVMGFLEIFTSGRYHRVMKIQKRLASKGFRVYGIFKKQQVDSDRGAAKYNIFLDNFCLK